jgi:hypothetical protein
MKRSFDFLFLTLGLLISGFPSIAHASDKTYNISTSPLSYFLMVPNLSVNYKLFDHLSLGPSISAEPSSWYEPSLTKNAANTLLFAGVMVTVSLDHSIFEDSWVFQAYGRAAFQPSPSGIQLSPNFGATLGYQWFFSSGFNAAFGLGVDYRERGIFAALLPLRPLIDVRIGYSF